MPKTAKKPGLAPLPIVDEEDANSSSTISCSQGALDYAEFVIDPYNPNSTPEQIIECAINYLGTLGLTRFQMREWLLEKLEEERRKHEK